MKQAVKFLLLLFFVANGWAAYSSTRTFKFPIKHAFDGPFVANSIQGVMVWGGGDSLVFTVAHAGFWDRRGASYAPPAKTYNELANMFIKGDTLGVMQALNGKKATFKHQHLGAGRMVLRLPSGYTPFQAITNLKTGRLEIVLKSKRGVKTSIHIQQHPTTALTYIKLPPIFNSGDTLGVKALGSFIPKTFEDREISPPYYTSTKLKRWKVKGFVQGLPQDEGLCMAVGRRGSKILISTALDSIPQNTSIAQKTSYSQILSFKKRELLDSAASWWASNYTQMPKLWIPDASLQRAWDYSIYKVVSLTAPHGPAATLQSCLMEDDALAPWSNDYHWNVNAQMMYEALLSTGKVTHFQPLWDMVNQWLPTLKENGLAFFEKEGAIWLPHATNDKGGWTGKFGSGKIDQGSTAWLAQLAWQYHEYTQDTAFLRQTAYPLIKGTWLGYMSMMRETTDAEGKPVYYLPLTSSPEYGGANALAYGKNASWQLAAFHSMTQRLYDCWQILGIRSEANLANVKVFLPQYSSITSANTLEYPEYTSKQLALSDGKLLPESHRHHSHLAGVWPFGTLLSQDSTSNNQALIEKSLYQTTRLGTGRWAGWSFPAAAIIYSKSGYTNHAIGLLKQWENGYLTSGGHSTHDAVYKGVSTYFTQSGKRPIMQLDASFGLLTAVNQIFVSEKSDGLHLLPEVPKDWPNCAIDNFSLPGGFILSAQVMDGQVVAVKVKASIAGQLVLHHGLGNDWELREGKEIKLAKEGEKLDQYFFKGQEVLLIRRSHVPYKLFDFNPGRREGRREMYQGLVERVPY